MRQVIKNNKGEFEVDPYGRKHDFEQWLKCIGYYDEKINYAYFDGISRQSSELIIRYIIDLTHGKNVAKGSGRGARSFNHLYNLKTRLPKTVDLMERLCKKELIHLDDDDVIKFFNAMRQGVIKTKAGNVYLSVGTYAKMFCAFWRWLVRTQPVDKIQFHSIVEHIDTREDEKPKWEYFTLKDVETMAEYTRSPYYKALIYFLFDSGIRAPKELMNVRVKDLTPVPESNYLFLQIRDETSKTFGRKIKLMICSDAIKKYVAHAKLQADDFLFTKSYAVMSRMVGYVGYKALKRGTVRQQKTNKILIKGGITMYDFRHNSVCHYLPIYKSENQMKYRYGWKKADMIHYYSEFIGMRDTISDDDMLIDTSKTELQQKLEKEQNRVTILEEQLKAKNEEMEQRMKKMEAIMLQKFADNFWWPK